MHLRVWEDIINTGYIICNNCFLSIRKGKSEESSIEKTPFGKGLNIKQIAFHGFSLSWNNRHAVIILVRFLHLKNFPSLCFLSISLGGFLKEVTVDFATKNIFSVDNTVYCLSEKRVKSFSHEYFSPGVNRLNFHYGNYKLLKLVVI